MSIITRADIQKLAPRPKSSASRAAIWDDYVRGLEDADDLLYEYGIDTRLELVHLLAQWAHESGGFTILWESGAYSSSRIMQIFGIGKHSAKVTWTEAQAIGRLRGEARARALFERVYGIGNPRKARELGNKVSGDGYNFRGWGIQQITGRRDHERLISGDYTPRGAIRAALIEWVEKGCSAKALNDDLKGVTRLINGGYNGLADRQRCLALAKSIWTHDPDFAKLAAKEVVEEPVEVVPPPPVAVEPPPIAPPREELRRTSRKWNLIEWLQRIFTGTGVGILGFASADNITAVKEYFDVLKTFTADYGVLLLAGGLVGGYVVTELLKRYTVEDYESGRYVPSGGAR